MSDPGFVKLASADTSMLVDSDGSLWSISGRNVLPFPANAAEARFVRRSLLQGKIVAATEEEYDTANPEIVVIPEDNIVRSVTGDGFDNSDPSNPVFDAAALSLDGGGSDHEVAFFIESVDMSVGDFTTVAAVGVGEIPRFYVDGTDLGMGASPGQVVCVVDGPSVGIWRLVAMVMDGDEPIPTPCALLTEIVAGETISSQALGGLIGGVWSDNGVTKVGTGALQHQVVELKTADTALDGRIATQEAFAASAGPSISEAESRLNAFDDIKIAEMIRLASVRDYVRAMDYTPSRWLQSGAGNDSCWKSTVDLASPTVSHRVRSLVRCDSVKPEEGGTKWLEVMTFPVDEEAGQYPGDDLYEHAIALDASGLWTYDEWTEVGGTTEILNMFGGLVPAGVWFWMEGAIDMAAGTLTQRVRTEFGWDYEDPDDSTHWVTVRVSELGRPTTLHAPYSGVGFWVGNGNGSPTNAYQIARVQRWHDGILVMDLDASAGAIDAQTIADSKMMDGENPAIWAVSSGAAKIQGES